VGRNLRRSRVGRPRHQRPHHPRSPRCGVTRSAVRRPAGGVWSRGLGAGAAWRRPREVAGELRAHRRGCGAGCLERSLDRLGTPPAQYDAATGADLDAPGARRRGRPGPLHRGEAKCSSSR
jgi:hypothetical protein